MPSAKKKVAMRVSRIIGTKNKKLLTDERRLIPNIYLTVIEIKLMSSPKFPPENSVMLSLITSSSS